MKEVRAYVRADKADEVHRALAKAGFRSMTVVFAEGTGSFEDTQHPHLSPAFSATSMKVAKIELISKEEDVGQIVELIQQHGKTGYAGDGIIVVSPVERAIRVRTGEEGTYVV